MSHMRFAGARLVPRYIYLVGNGLSFAVDCIGPGISEHAPDQDLRFVGCGNRTRRFLAVTPNNNHDHTSVRAVVDVTGWMDSHDIRLSAGCNLLADIGHELPSPENLLLNGGCLPGLRQRLARNGKNQWNKK